MALTHNKHLAFYVIKYENDVLDEAVTTGERLSISRTTLWHRVKRQYIIPIEIGGKQRYKLSDVNAILKGDNEVFKEA